MALGLVMSHKQSSNVLWSPYLIWSGLWKYRMVKQKSTAVVVAVAAAAVVVINEFMVK